VNNPTKIFTERTAILASGLNTPWIVNKIWISKLTRQIQVKECVIVARNKTPTSRSGGDRVIIKCSWREYLLETSTIWKIDARVAEKLDKLFILILVGVVTLNDARVKLRIDREIARVRARSDNTLIGSGKKSKGPFMLSINKNFCILADFDFAFIFVYL
jgi:hypothetical protein